MADSDSTSIPPVRYFTTDAQGKLIEWIPVLVQPQGWVCIICGASLAPHCLVCPICSQWKMWLPWP